PPKQTIKLTTEKKKELAHDITEFLEAYKEQTEKRRKELSEKIDAYYLELRDDIRRAAELILSKDVLNMNLFEFLRATTVNESTETSEELSTASKNPSSEKIDITSEAVAAFENLSIPVETKHRKILGADRLRRHFSEDDNAIVCILHKKVYSYYFDYGNNFASLPFTVRVPPSCVP
ncbi:unnamed protein product, partial [Strongylus vulgaris]